jgi:hypothetical protein
MSPSPPMDNPPCSLSLPIRVTYDLDTMLTAGRRRGQRGAGRGEEGRLAGFEESIGTLDETPLLGAREGRTRLEDALGEAGRAQAEGQGREEGKDMSSRLGNGGSPHSRVDRSAGD